MDILFEFLIILFIFASVPARIGWSLISTGEAFRVFLGTSMIIIVYGGIVGALWRGGMRLIRPQLQRRRRRRRQATP